MNFNIYRIYLALSLIKISSYPYIYINTELFFMSFVLYKNHLIYINIWDYIVDNAGE